MTPQELSHLDYEGASQMLLAYATDAKKYEKEIASLQAQAAEWKSKARLAHERSMEDLSQAALQKSAELEAKVQDLALELNSIRRDIEDLRTALPLIKAKQRSVDPDRLLAELSMLVGFEEKPAENSTKGAEETPAQPNEKEAAPGTAPRPDRNPTTLPSDTTLEAQQPASSSVDEALAELKKKMGLS